MELEGKLLGQVMTPHKFAACVVSLLKNHEDVLEPSCGTGVFLDLLPEAKGCELHRKLVPSDQQHRVWVGNFFEYPTTTKFRSCVGNPPYVNGRDIDLSIFARRDYHSVLPATANLYLHFIEKCFHHLERAGDELVFIVPTSLFIGSYGRPLRELLLKKGGFTNVLWNTDVSWSNASTETCVFRYELGADSKITIVDDKTKFVSERNGFMFMTSYKPLAFIGDFFTACVGAAGRSDLERPAGSAGAVEFHDLNRTRWYDISTPWMWPRWKHPQPGPKILFNPGPTRKHPRFKVSNEGSYTCHALFPKKYDINLIKWSDFLEQYNDWQELGFILNGRWSAGPKALEAAPLRLLP